RASCCCVLTSQACRWPKTPSSKPWKSPALSRRKLSSCAAPLDLRASTVQPAGRGRYRKCSRRSSPISEPDKTFPKSRKRKACSRMVDPSSRFVGWVERSDTHRLWAAIDGYRYAPPILPITVVIPLNGKRLRLAAVDAMRHDRADENSRPQVNAAACKGEAF